MRIFSTISFAVKFGVLCLLIGLGTGLYLGAHAVTAGG